MSSFKRTAAAWVLRQAVRRASESSARRRQAWTNPGPTGTGTGGGWAGGSRPDTGATYPGAPGPSTSYPGTAGSSTTYPGTGTAGPEHQATGEHPGWARSTGSRSTGFPGQMEEIVRRAWPLLDTPANRQRAARFVERMRTVADSPR